MLKTQRRWRIALGKVVRTPEHQFLRYLVNIFRKLPDDPFYEHIDPYLKIWLYESWLHDNELEVERLRNQAILVGSFFNPEAAQKMIKSEKPDFASTDVEETSKAIRKQILDQDNKTKRRKKRKVIKKVV